MSVYWLVCLVYKCWSGSEIDETESLRESPQAFLVQNWQGYSMARQPTVSCEKPLFQLRALNQNMEFTRKKYCLYRGK